MPASTTFRLRCVDRTANEMAFVQKWENCSFSSLAFATLIFFPRGALFRCPEDVLSHRIAVLSVDCISVFSSAVLNLVLVLVTQVSHQMNAIILKLITHLITGVNIATA